MRLFIDGKPLGECVDSVALDHLLNPPLSEAEQDLKNRIVQRITFKADRVDWEVMVLYTTTDPFEWVDAAYRYMKSRAERGFE